MWSVDPSQGGDAITTKTLMLGLWSIGRADSVFHCPVLDSHRRLGVGGSVTRIALNHRQASPGEAGCIRMCAAQNAAGR